MKCIKKTSYTNLIQYIAIMVTSQKIVLLFFKFYLSGKTWVFFLIEYC